MRRNGPSFTAVLFLAVAIPVLLASTAVAGPSHGFLAGGGYWTNFWKFWSNIFGSTSGIVFTALGVGAISLLIITRGKWKK